MKFDCLKVAGKLDSVHVICPMNGGYKATLSIDSVRIPNVQLTNKIYEELEEGENITLYGIFKNSKSKEKNIGVIYGLQKQSGEKMFATSLRLLAPMMLAVYAAIAFCLVFAIGFFVSWIPVAYIFGRTSPGEFIHHSVVFALVEGALAAAFFLWKALALISVTNDPESWQSMQPALLSNRFSKFHK